MSWAHTFSYNRWLHEWSERLLEDCFDDFIFFQCSGFQRHHIVDKFQADKSLNLRFQTDIPSDKKSQCSTNGMPPQLHPSVPSTDL